MNSSIEQELCGKSFTGEDLARDTIIGGRIVQSLVDAPTFSRESLLRDTYLATDISFPYMVSADSLKEAGYHSN